MRYFTGIKAMEIEEFIKWETVVLILGLAVVFTQRRALTNLISRIYLRIPPKEGVSS